MTTDDYADHLRALVEGVNGFVYPGDRMNAVIDTVKVLRANPDLAGLLLGQEA